MSPTETPETLTVVPADQIPHLTTVQEILDTPAVPTLVGPPSGYGGEKVSHTEYPIDPSTPEYALLALGWSQREQAIQKAEEAFSALAFKVASECHPGLTRRSPWKIGVGMTEDATGQSQLEFAVLVWPS